MAKIKAASAKKENLTEAELQSVVSYFQEPSNLPLILMLCGVMVFFGGIFVLIGIVCLGLGIYLYSENQKNKVTDEEFDRIKDKAYGLLDDVAYSKLGLDKSDTVRENLFIKGPRYYDGGANLVFKEGEDKVIRYSLHNIIILVFTKKYLAMYQCALDLQTGNRLNEVTEEFFYKDIVSVGTQVKSSTLLKEGTSFNYIAGNSKKQISVSQEVAWESFELRNAGSGSIEVPIKSSEILKQMGGKFEENELDKVVNSIRAILRDKK